MDYQTGLCFVNFLIAVFAIPDSTHFYSANLDEFSFVDAQDLCASDGSLANIPDQEEILKILKVIENKRDRNSTSFWIGLKKDRTQCVLADLPLKGFHWTVDNSSKFELNKWKEEPSGTCTNALCGLISVEYEGSRLVNWGLTAQHCGKKFPFICKHKGSSKKKTCSSLPQILGDHGITQKTYDPHTLFVSCPNSDTFTLTCSRTKDEWLLVGGTGTDLEGLCLQCQNGYKKDQNGNCVSENNCSHSHNCKFKCMNAEGCKCIDDSSNSHSEASEICQKANMVLFIPTTDDTTNQGKPTTSSMDNESPTSPQPAVHSTNESGVHPMERTGDMSDIVIPLIIALLIFVVLVVIIVAIVKYCHMRSARKRAKKRAAALKESVALNGSDSMEKVNE